MDYDSINNKEIRDAEGASKKVVQLDLFKDTQLGKLNSPESTKPYSIPVDESKQISILRIAYEDFILSRQGINCTTKTVDLYKFVLNKVVEWLERHGINTPKEFLGYHVRAILGEMKARECSDSYMHIFARNMKTFVKFLLVEHYIDNPITFEMPKLVQTRLLTYSAEDIQTIINHCTDKRSFAYIYLMVDSGLRRAEVLALNWGDLDMSSGVVRVEKGKGRKPRSVIVGPRTRRELLKYRSTIDSSDNKPLIQTIKGTRFTKSGLRSWLLRLSKDSGVHITSHALRRTFASFSFRAGMNLFELQGLMGHSSLEMTRHYITILEEDLVKAHEKHGPIDYILSDRSEK